jgi:hypothetical protein
LVCSSRGIGTVSTSESQSIVLTSSMSFLVLEVLQIGFSPAIVGGSCPFARLSMPPTEGSMVLISGGGGSGGRFSVSRLDMVRSEDIKLMCNGENGRRTETRFTIWFYEIVLIWKMWRCHELSQRRNSVLARPTNSCVVEIIFCSQGIAYCTVYEVLLFAGPRIRNSLVIRKDPHLFCGTTHHQPQCHAMLPWFCD